MNHFVLGIPRCNEPEAIFAETLAAVRASSAQPVRRIIVDNGDAPLGPVKDFDVVRPEGGNIGCAGAWNKLARMAFHEAPAVVLLNADMAVAPETFARLFASPHQVVCAFGFGCFRLDREVWLRVGPFDVEFFPAYWEDADYRRRLSLAGIHLDEWPIGEEVARPSFGRAIYANGMTHGWRHEDGREYQGWQGEKAAWFQERWKANRDRYIAKWGGEVGAETFPVPFNR